MNEEQVGRLVAGLSARTLSLAGRILPQSIPARFAVCGALAYTLLMPGTITSFSDPVAHLVYATAGGITFAAFAAVHALAENSAGLSAGRQTAAIKPAAVCNLSRWSLAAIVSFLTLFVLSAALNTPTLVCAPTLILTATVCLLTALIHTSSLEFNSVAPLISLPELKAGAAHLALRRQRKNNLPVEITNPAAVPLSANLRSAIRAQRRSQARGPLKHALQLGKKQSPYVEELMEAKLHYGSSQPIL